MSSPRADPTSHNGRPTVLLVDLEPALASLFAEWLGLAGMHVAEWKGAGTSARFDLAVVEVPFPRMGGDVRLQQMAQHLPGTPILALSPTFFAGVASGGAVARQLGVAAVLATPVARDTLVAAVVRLVGQAP